MVFSKIRGIRTLHLTNLQDFSKLCFQTLAYDTLYQIKKKVTVTIGEKNISITINFHFSLKAIYLKIVELKILNFAI